MALNIKRRENGKVELAKWPDGHLAGVISRDDSALLGRAHVNQVGYDVGLGVPVDVRLPSGATHIEWRGPSGRDLLSTAGVVYITPTDLDRTAGLDVVEAFYRPVVPNSGPRSTWQRGRWRRKKLFITDPSPPPPTGGALVVTGTPSMTAASSVIGAAVTYTWPVTDRAPSEVQHLLRLYDAAVDGTLVDTIAAPTTLPNEPDAFAVPFWRALDPFTGAWIELEGEVRLGIEEDVDPAEIVQGDVTFTVAWQDPAQRILFSPQTIIVAGVGRTDGLRARFMCGRFTTAWVELALADGVSTIRTFPAITAPAREPGLFVTDLWPRGEERFRLQLSKREGAGAWTDPGDGMIEIPVPAGTIQPTATVTTNAALANAITAARAQSSVQCIAVSADIANSAAINNSGWIKPGRPLIITVEDPNDPANFSGYEGTKLSFTNCENIILDGLSFHNDQTVALGDTGIPPQSVPNGSPVLFYNSRRFHVTNCLFRRNRNAVRAEHCETYFIGFNEFHEISEDSIRAFGSSRDRVVEGNYFHHPIVYQLLAKEGGEPSYHPDCDQLAMVNVTGPRSGHFNGKTLRNRIYSPDAVYQAAFFYKSDYAMKNPATIDSTGIVNFLIEGNYIENAKSGSPALIGAKGCTIRNNVSRTSIAGYQPSSCHVVRLARDITIQNSFAPVAVYTAEPGGPMTSAQIQDEITGAFTISTSATPAGWAAGSARYPTGRYAYAT